MQGSASAMRVRRWVVFLVWLVGTAALSWQLLIYPEQPGPGPKKDVSFFIEDDESLAEVRDRLLAEGIISDGDAWLRFMRLMTAGAPLVRGYVPVNAALSAKEQARRLLDVGAHPAIRLNIPEGFTRFDIATRLERMGICDRERFLAVTTSTFHLEQLDVPGASAEGYLFPATYELELNRGEGYAMRRMVQAFRARTARLARELTEKRARGETSLSLHEAVTLASVVEKEAAVADERPIIARVFLNRLNDPSFRPRRLQADPTAAYGCLVAPTAAQSCSEFDGRRITPSMLRDVDNRYNTYRHDGLPPGPIANPGLSALEAVIHPAEHDYLYFVATGGGRHSFSRTLDEHNARIRGE